MMRSRLIHQSQHSVLNGPFWENFFCAMEKILLVYIIIFEYILCGDYNHMFWCLWRSLSYLLHISQGPQLGRRVRSRLNFSNLHSEYDKAMLVLLMELFRARCINLHLAAILLQKPYVTENCDWFLLHYSTFGQIRFMHNN